MTLNSTLVLVTDTWLHFSTKTIIFTQVGANPDPSGLGFGIHHNCSEQTPEIMTCTLVMLYNGYVREDNGALKVFANVSDTMSIPVHTDSQDQYVYIAHPRTSRTSTLDYTVGTYAIHTQCLPVTPRCIDRSAGYVNVVNYTCPFDMKGQIDTLNLAGNADVIDTTIFSDVTGSTIQRTKANPYYHSAMLVTGRGMDGPPSLKTDPDVYGGIYEGGTIVAVFCNSTVYDVTYSSVNNKVTNWNASLTNSTTMSLFSGGSDLLRLSMPYTVQAVSLAGFSKTGREIADKYALAYARNTLGATALAFEPRNASASQQRKQIQVAMVPKTSLYVLIGANLLLVLFGVVLSTLALIALKGDTGEVQARLSIHALVAAAFEARAGKPFREVEEFFEEKHGEQGPRLGFVRTMDGGWTFERHGGDQGN